MEVHVENDAGVEEAGATDTVAFMEAHWANLLHACEVEEECRLCDQDEHLYKVFRSNFALLDVSVLPEDCIQGERWRAVLLGLETRVQDYNMMTLLRRYAHLSYDDPAQELKVVPRAAFYLVEVARNREGVYCDLLHRLLDRKLQLGLEMLVSASEEQDVRSLYRALAGLSALNRGRIKKAVVAKVGAGRILRSVYESFNAEAGKVAVFALWKQWKYGFDLEGNDRATQFAEMRCNTVQAINKLYGNRRFSIRSGGQKRICDAKIDLEQFPLFATKSKLLVACGYCVREDIRENPSFARVALEENTLLQSLRVLLLTYEELQSLSFASLCGNVKLSDVIEHRVQKLLRDSVDSLPHLTSLINTSDVNTEPDRETEIRAKDFKKGLSLVPVDDSQPDSMYAITEEAEKTERTMIAGVENICKKRPQTSRNECFLTFFQELHKGATKSVLDASQEEAYIAETDQAQECLKQLGNDERESLINTLTPRSMCNMRNKGFAVVDDFLDMNLLRKARSDMEALSGQLEFNAQALKGMRRRDDVVTHVSAESLIDLGFVNLSKVLKKLRAVPGLLEEFGEDCLYVPKEVMFACYKGPGARHQSHRDNYPMKGDDGDNGRVLTALLYMNPDWSQEMGGQLRLQLNVPLERAIDMKQFDSWDNTESKGEATASGEHLDVEPYGGRLVIFKSREIVHSVLPLSNTAGNRMALTLWVTDKVQEASFAFTKLTF